MNERELFRRARVARFHGESWRDFWTRNREAIIADFPLRADRARLVDALQQIVVLGMGEPVRELTQ